MKQKAANNLTQAGQFTTQAGNYQPQQVSPTGINPAFAGPAQQYGAAGVQAGQLSNTSLAPYQNPLAIYKP